MATVPIITVNRLERFVSLVQALVLAEPDALPKETRARLRNNATAVAKLVKAHEPGLAKDVILDVTTCVDSMPELKPWAEAIQRRAVDLSKELS